MMTMMMTTTTTKTKTLMPTTEKLRKTPSNYLVTAMIIIITLAYQTIPLTERPGMSQVTRTFKTIHLTMVADLAAGLAHTPPTSLHIIKIYDTPQTTSISTPNCMANTPLISITILASILTTTTTDIPS